MSNLDDKFIICVTTKNYTDLLEVWEWSRVPAEGVSLIEHTVETLYKRIDLLGGGEAGKLNDAIESISAGAVTQQLLAVAPKWITKKVMLPRFNVPRWMIIIEMKSTDDQSKMRKEYEALVS